MSMLQLLASLASAKVGTDEQFLRPVGDDGQNTFGRYPGSGSRWTKIDEVVADDDATYIKQDVDQPLTATLDIELTSSGIETPHPNQVVSAHFVQKSLPPDVTGTGNGWSALLYQGDPSSGGSLVATMFDEDVGPPNGTYVDLSATLSGGEKAAITDWNDLWIRLTADFVLPGGEWRLTQVYLQIDPL